ncbi:MAG: SUMF1/EgtB/PvdO family nonheme iron enzyme [Gemmataceae bacterium]
MPRKASFILMVITLVMAGCANKGARPSSGDDGVLALEVFQPKSGGEMVLVPSGTFLMGDAEGRADESPHEVSVTSFYLDKVPVTQELYEKVMRTNPSKRKEKNNPVERTQWMDAARFCNKCSEIDGLAPCYDLVTWDCNFAANGYRLPTEAEWEYACRAGNTGKFCCGDAEADLVQYAWFKPHSKGRPQPVGQKRPNRWGLYDMHGNVWQWCNDFYSENYYADSRKEDPRGPSSGEQRVLRGGAWDCTAEKCRAAYRAKEFPVFSDACFGADSYGFRRARNQDAGVDKTVAVKPTAQPQSDAIKNSAKESSPALPVPVAASIEVAKLKGTIVFVSDRSGTLKIWKMHASGKDANQLTHNDHAEADPRFSPDGKRILYTSLRDGFAEVWLMNRDGSNPKFVTKGSQANWSPDSRSITFIQDNQAYTRELASGKEKRVTPEKWERCGVPAWSPDGKHIALASRHLGSIGIFLIDLDGTANRPLKTEEACCTPEWSKDGKRLLCQSVQGHIHQVGVDGKDCEQLTFGADLQHDARYSPDGTMILFCRAPSPEGPWQICVKRLDGDDDADYAPITKEGSNLLPDWHADED